MFAVRVCLEGMC